MSWLSWLSPQGWSLQVRPYAGDRLWVLLLHALLTVVLIGGAYALASRRDLGGGLLGDRPGPARASAKLSGPFGLAWRLQRTTLLGWTVGLGLYALLLGSVVHGVADELGDGQAMRDVLERLGGAARPRGRVRARRLHDARRRRGRVRDLGDPAPARRGERAARRTGARGRGRAAALGRRASRVRRAGPRRVDAGRGDRGRTGLRPERAVRRVRRQNCLPLSAPRWCSYPRSGCSPALRSPCSASCRASPRSRGACCPR